MESIKKFLQRKNIVFSAKRYGIDALGAMAQGLFCSLLIGTILNTLGSQFHIDFLTAQSPPHASSHAQSVSPTSNHKTPESHTRHTPLYPPVLQIPQADASP